MRMHIKRCLIDFQKGVSNRAKGHLLQVNWALISHPLKTIFQHKACTNKLYADSFYKVQKNS